MNNLDKQYLELVKDIIDNGVEKKDRTGTGTISVFGRQIRHKMSEGFPLLTTKKLHWKSIVTELIWFLRGDTNIKWLLEQGNTIWVGDAYKNYLKHFDEIGPIEKMSSGSIMFGATKPYVPFTQEEFINRIKIDDVFAKKWGELGPIYGSQWRGWVRSIDYDIDYTNGIKDEIDQISNLINDLKNNPDSRRLMVNAWNVGEIDQMVLPPCHYGFQVYTRELKQKERLQLLWKVCREENIPADSKELEDFWLRYNEIMSKYNIPTRAISLMWNQRSVDVGLGLPFNIASYGLLLEIIAKAVNMVPDELIGNLGDTHLYSNHVEPIKEQFSRELNLDERCQLANFAPFDISVPKKDEEFEWNDRAIKIANDWLNKHHPDLPTKTREPFPLPTLTINTEFWPRVNGENEIDAIEFINKFKDNNFCKCLLEDIQLVNYQSHPTIKLPLSN
jgi:thymidylate synthase